MSATEFDNRMGIFRFIDQDYSEEHLVQERYVLASDKRITGHVTLLSLSGKKRISVRGWQMDTDRNGLYKYIVTFNYGINISDKEEREKKTKERWEKFYTDGDLSKPMIKVDGYRFHGGDIEEICSLLSLCFQARFYLLFKFDDSMKTDYEWNFFPVRRGLHPTIFDKEPSDNENNFNRDFEPLLKKIAMIDPSLHQGIAFSVYSYREALHAVGINNNIVLTHLVSSIETLLDGGRNSELVGRLKNEIKDSAALTKEEKNDIYTSVGHIGVKKAFVKFIIDHASQWPDFKKPDDPEWLKKIEMKGSGIYSFIEVLKRIYNSRSAYLHEGAPVFIERPERDSLAHFSMSGGAIIDNTSYLEKDKLPFLYVFEDIVRFSILKFINNKTE